MPQLFKTQGIVLHQIKYGETSIIAKIYTEQFGLQSFIIRGVRSPRSKIKPALLQVGILLDMVIYFREKSTIQQIKEVKPAYHFISIPFDITKSSILLFLTEILYKSIREEESNPLLFRFIFENYIRLDRSTGKVADFHLFFLIRLTRYLGFYPHSPAGHVLSYFDLREGVFLNLMPVHSDYIKPPLSELFRSLVLDQQEDHFSPGISSSARQDLLEKLLVYYRFHLPSVREIKSHHILREVLS